MYKEAAPWFAWAHSIALGDKEVQPFRAGPAFVENVQQRGTIEPRGLQRLSQCPDAARDSGSHGGCPAKRLIDAAEVVISKWSASAAQRFSHFLLKAFLSRVNLRICMRIVRFFRSTRVLQTRSGLVLPITSSGTASTTSGGE
jgi:hypothetical protein